MEIIPEKAIYLVKKYEGFSPVAYICPAGYWTIGFGTRYVDGREVRQGDMITHKKAEELMLADCTYRMSEIKKMVKVPITENQLAVLISFSYNFGLNALRTSTLLKKLNVNLYEQAALELDRWVYSNGKVLQGLVKRRKEEKQIFLTK